MVSEAELLSSLIGNIYDAALDASLWPSVLKSAAGFVGGSGSSLYMKNVARKSADYFYNWGITQESLDSYFKTYVKFDPVTVGQFVHDVEEIYSTIDVMPYDEFMQTRFYREWVAPNRFADHIAATLDKSVITFSVFGVFKRESEGLVDDENRRRMRLIVPHIRRAVLIGNVIDLHKYEGAALADSIDGIDASVFLVDETGRITYANAAAKWMLDEGTVVRESRKLIVLPDIEADQVLRESILAASSGDNGLGVKGVALPLQGADGERWLIHVLPLTSGARKRAGIQYAATAALFVRKSALDAPSPIETIAKLYKLTPTELRVLGAVMECGGSVPVLSETLGISKGTAKTHLRHLLQKTGVRRQIDLVKLVAEHATPLIS